MIQLKKTEKTVDKQFAVMGLNRFAQSVVKTLMQHGCHVLACDIDPSRVEEARAYASRVVQVDISDENELGSIGIGNFDVVVIAIENDLETAITATMICKEKGAGYVLVKARGARQKKILEIAGADEVILTENEMGEKTAKGLMASNVIEYMSISDEYSIAEISPPENWVGKTLESARIRADKAINVIAIRRGASMIISPRASEAILKNDILVVLGENTSIKSAYK